MRTANPHFTNLLNEMGNLAVAIFSTVPEADLLPIDLTMLPLSIINLKLYANHREKNATNKKGIKQKPGGTRRQEETKWCIFSIFLHQTYIFLYHSNYEAKEQINFEVPKRIRLPSNLAYSLPKWKETWKCLLHNALNTRRAWGCSYTLSKFILC